MHRIDWSFGSLLFLDRPDPERLLTFYRKVRPIGWWGPLRELVPEVRPDLSLVVAIIGVFGGLALIFGLLFGMIPSKRPRWQALDAITYRCSGSGLSRRYELTRRPN